MSVDPDLQRLADAHGVATAYDDQLRRRIEVPRESVVAVLGALGVDATTERQVRQALTDAQRPAGPAPIVVLRAGESRPSPFADASAVLRCEDGSSRDIGGTLPVGLPLGWHLLECGEQAVPVVVAPDRLVLPPGRGWGWMVQLYATPSARSWGLGDLADLADLARWTGRHGGDLVLVNPLHAVAPVAPVQPSPYYPASRRWANPLYLRVEATGEYAAAGPQLRARVDALRVPPGADLLDRDAVWTAKLAALELLWGAASSTYDLGADEGLVGYATWAALTEVHGPDWRTWPESLRHPAAPAVARAAAGELRERVRFHGWLQSLCAQQLDAAQDAARRAGMSVGVVHDLAIGCDPAGVDAWTLQDSLALGAHIGAPPDTFNQQGQDWGMPPWHPRRLAEAGYLPLRDMLRATLAHAGGIRIDHVLGLFRMWWVPAGGSARDGTYVRYDADALLGVVTLEAARAGAIVVGEDLGTVTPGVRRTLADRGVLGTSVLWFERTAPKDGAPGRLRPPAQWRAEAVASVTTHDLPTVLGWLRGEHVRVRAELGLLDDPEQEWRTWERERAEILALVQAEGLVGAEPDEDDLALALHLVLARTPCRFVLAAPGDAVGDLRQPNLPGTTDEYPSWRLPVSDATGRGVSLDELLADARVQRLAAELTRGVR